MLQRLHVNRFFGFCDSKVFFYGRYLNSTHGEHDQYFEVDAGEVVVAMTSNSFLMESGDLCSVHNTGFIITDSAIINGFSPNLAINSNSWNLASVGNSKGKPWKAVNIDDYSSYYGQLMILSSEDNGPIEFPDPHEELRCSRCGEKFVPCHSATNLCILKPHSGHLTVPPSPDSPFLLTRLPLPSISCDLATT